MYFYIYYIIYVLFYRTKKHVIFEGDTNKSTPIDSASVSKRSCCAWRTVELEPSGFIMIYPMTSGYSERYSHIYNYTYKYTIWLFNIAMENHHAINR